MAKLKFNLKCDDQNIRTIEDLQNNFVIEDVLAYYTKQILHKWLEVRGYTEELEKVQAIATDEPIEIVKELVKIFGVDSDDETIEKGVCILEYLEGRKTYQEEIKKYQEERKKCQAEIEKYKKEIEKYREERKEVHSSYEKAKNHEDGYDGLVNEILQNPNNAAIVKANISEIVSNYPRDLERNHKTLFYKLKDVSPLAIMRLLMDERSRKYYLPIQIMKANGTKVYDIEWNNKDKADMFACICQMITTSNFKKQLGTNLKSFSGLTHDKWENIEPAGKKYMIIKMGKGNSIFSASLFGSTLNSRDIENEFIITDGIDYKGRYSYDALLYMEV